MSVPLDRLVMAIIVIVGVPAVMVAYVALVEWVVGRLPFRVRGRARPWLWLGPTLLLLIAYLIYPTLNTIYLSFFNYDSTQFVGLENFRAFLHLACALIALRRLVEF